MKLKNNFECEDINACVICELCDEQYCDCEYCVHFCFDFDVCSECKFNSIYDCEVN